MRPDIVPGGTFPDYELPDHTRTARKLSWARPSFVDRWRDLRDVMRERAPAARSV